MARTHPSPEPSGPGPQSVPGRSGLAGLVSGWRGHDPSAGARAHEVPADTGPLRRVGPPPVPPRDAPDTAQQPALGPPPDRPAPVDDGGAPRHAAADGAGRPEDDDLERPPMTALPDAPGAEAAGGPVLDVPGGSPAAASTGRAGRDMVAAISVGLGLGAVILLALLVWRPAFLLVIIAAVLVSVVELSRALAKGGYRAALPPLVVGSLAIVALAWTRGPTGLVVGFLLTVFAVLLWRLGDGPVGYLRDASAAVFVALYIPLLAGFAVLLLVPDDGVARVLTFIGCVVCSDVGGFAAGVLAGRHPLAPSVSPKKSWEGLGGSVAACVLIGTLLVTLTFHGPWWGGVLFGVAMAVTATLGDLGESLIKRDLGIKDMGNLLPGHGGLMDRMDSLLPSAAVAYLILSVVAPV
jgi:phosphatidate cytidylyltransferase